MNKISLCFVLLGAAAAFGLSHAVEFSCAPNESYQDDCNTCLCSSDGKSAACTLMGCFSETSISSENATTEEALVEMETNNQVCTPNDIKMQDCNRCRCAMNGIGWFCTRRGCPPKNGLQKREVQNPITKCRAGDSWKEDCNNCFCTATGLPVCTKMGCIGSFGNLRRKRDLLLPSMRHVTEEEFNKPEFTCTPTEFFKLECNTCKCAENGKTVTRCTKKICVNGE